MTDGPDPATYKALSADEVQELFYGAPCGVAVVDAKSGAILYVNSVVSDALGIEVGAVTEMPVTAIFTVDTADTVQALLRAVSRIAGNPVAASASLRGKLSPLGVSIMAVQVVLSSERTVVQLSMHSSAVSMVRENALSTDRDRAHAAQHVAEAALGRSQVALESSEEARKRAEAERTRSQLLAATLQRTLIPPRLVAPPGTDIAGYYHPASMEDVGGDFYDVFPLDGHTWAFFLGDVSGKGAGAAAVTSLTRYTLRAAAVFDRDPITVLNNLNTVLHHEFRGDDPRFCTVIYGVLTLDGNNVRIDIASGGHPPALALRADGTADYISTLGGQLVGALPKPHFVAASISLDPGDVLVLYTDGLTEAVVGPDRSRYNDDGALHRFAAAAAPTTASRLIEQLQTLLSGFGDGVQDDVALLAIGNP